MNKTKLLEIAQALNLGTIDDEKARTLLLDLLDVSRSANTDEYTKGYRDGWRDCCKDQKEFD